MQLYLVCALIFALLVAFFAIQNTTIVIIHFLFWQAEMSLVIVILGSVAAGALLLFFFSLFKQFRSHREKKNLIIEKDNLVKELKAIQEKIEIQTKAAAANVAVQPAIVPTDVQDQPDA